VAAIAARRHPLEARASLVTVSRVLAGMRYPSDVLASLVVSAASGFVMARLLMRPVLAPLVKLVSRLSDPLLSSLAGLAAIRRTALSPLFRSRLVAVVCAVIFVRIVVAERAQLLDELPILVLAAWTFLTVVSVQLAARRYWPQHERPIIRQMQHSDLANDAFGEDGPRLHRSWRTSRAGLCDAGPLWVVPVSGNQFRLAKRGFRPRKAVEAAAGAGRATPCSPSR
jgi:hypothetical protein